VQVHALADMLDVPDLKFVAMEKLQLQLEDHWAAASFTEIVKETYSVTNARDKEIRDLMITSALNHIDELRKLEEFKEVLCEVGEFSGGLVISPLSNLSIRRSVSGPSTSDPKYYCCARWCATHCFSCHQWKSGVQK
jgi:hypothetical protein